MCLGLTRRTLDDPIHGHCSVCFETRRLQQLVILDADELAVCHGCYAAARFGRLSRGTPSCSSWSTCREAEPASCQVGTLSGGLTGVRWHPRPRPAQNRAN
jgi:hypothetical protein